MPYLFTVPEILAKSVAICQARSDLVVISFVKVSSEYRRVFHWIEYHRKNLCNKTTILQHF